MLNQVQAEVPANAFDPPGNPGMPPVTPFKPTLQLGRSGHSDESGIAGAVARPTRKTAAELNEIFDVPCSPFMLEKTLGQGTFGMVFRSRTASGHVVAIKQVVEDENYVTREVEICKILAAANHPNIVEVVGLYFTADQHHGRTSNLVMEYLPQTMRSVLSFLSRRNMRIKL
jgi:serine/threonine protein kinase